VGSARGIRLSPDGQKTAIGLIDSEGRTNVWTIDLTTKARTQVTFTQDKSSLVSSFTAWSPDGRTLVYPIKQDDGFGIARRPAVGGTEEVIYSVPPEQRALQYPRTTEWSRDGAISIPVRPPADSIGCHSRGFVRHSHRPGIDQESTHRPEHPASSLAERWFSYQGGNAAVVRRLRRSLPGRRQATAGGGAGNDPGLGTGREVAVLRGRQHAHRGLGF
jgi:hypothetical protein